MNNRVLSYLGIIMGATLPVAAWGADVSIPGSEGSVVAYIQNFYLFALGLGGVLAVGMIVVGGILIATGSVVNQQSKGKEMITGAITGLVLLVGAYFVLKTINPELVSLRSPGQALPACQPGDGRISGQTCLPVCREGEDGVPGVDCAPLPAPPQTEVPPQCNQQVLLTCPNRFETTAPIPANATTPFLGVTDNNAPGGYWYREDEAIHADNIVWGHPYYIDAQAAGASVPASLTGPDKARCIIYAERECCNNLACSGGLTNCSSTKINLHRIDLQDWVRPC